MKDLRATPNPFPATPPPPSLEKNALYMSPSHSRTRPLTPPSSHYMTPRGSLATLTFEKQEVGGVGGVAPGRDSHIYYLNTPPHMGRLPSTNSDAIYEPIPGLIDELPHPQTRPPLPDRPPPTFQPHPPPSASPGEAGSEDSDYEKMESIGHIMTFSSATI